MIRIWGNKLAVCIPECIPVEKGMTLYEWFISDGMPEDCEYEVMPISVWIDNVQILPNVWKTTPVYPGLNVDVYREPKGTDPFSITFALVFGAKAVLAALMPKIPSINQQSNRQGKDLDIASAKGNRVRVNDVIPELAGFNLRYPDLMGQPRRYYAGPREQWIEMQLCVGKGDYVFDPASVKTGLTSFSSLGVDARYAVYGPGEYLGTEAAHLMWYTAPEVGSSSTGTAGLELTASTDLTISAIASVYNFSGNVVSIPTGAGSFPADWSANLIINIGDPYSYTVEDGTGTGGRDVIKGGNVANLGFSVGDQIEIRGDNSGLYEVFSYTSSGTPQLQLNYLGGSPAIGLSVGSKAMAIGFRGLKYRIVTYAAQSLLVQRLRYDDTVHAAWVGWVSSSTNAGRVELDSSNLQGGYRGPFPACPDNEKITTIEWDMFYPSGIVGLGSKGEYFNISTWHQFEWRDADLGGAWTIGSYSMSWNSLDAIGQTFQIALPYPMRAECRVKKLIIPQGGLSKDEIHDVTMWQGLKGLTQSTKEVFNDVTVMMVYIRGGDRIASQTENLVSLECTRVLPELDGNGNFGPPVPTRKISSWVWHVLKSVGYTLNDLNVTELQRLELMWSARFDTYDKIVSSASTVKDNLIECLRVGFAELTIDKGQIRPVRDEPRGLVFNHIYNPQNMREPLTEDFVTVDYDDFNGVDVEYLDEKTWTNLTVQCRIKNFPGLVDDIGTQVYKLKLEGVHNRDKAYQIGMRERMRQVFQKKEYSFSTEWAALNSRYGDYVALGDNTPGYAKSSILKTFTPVGDVYILVSSEPFDWTTGGAHLVGIRREDGTLSGPYEAERLDDNRLTISKAEFDADPTGFYPDFQSRSEPPFLQFGPEDIWCYPALITEVNPNGTKYCSVKAVNYDARLYTYDNAYADN